MNSDDRLKFAILMNKIGEVCAGDGPSPEKIDIYFNFLQDLDLETIEQNARVYVSTNKSNKGFFPPVAYLRDPRDPDEIEALETAAANAAFSRVKWYMENFYFDGFGNTAMIAIETKMKKSGEEHLLPLLNQWGSEILTGQTQVVRAQFVKAVKGESRIMNRSNLLPGRKVLSLGEAAKNLIAGIQRA